METIENCIVREIEEELNVIPEVGPMLFINQGLLKKYHIHLIQFFYLIMNGSDFCNIDLAHFSHGFEISELKGIDLDDITANLFSSTGKKKLWKIGGQCELSMWFLIRIEKICSKFASRN